jgi:hypothetical protein
MTISSAHATAFYREVAATQVVWAIRDAGGFPAPQTFDGKRSMPFWSSKARAAKVVKNVAAYKGFEPVGIPWSVFCERWVPGLTTDGLLAGINWAGPAATGYDVPPVDVQRNVEALVRAGA